MIQTADSSVGRAEDCRILWLSLGRWFNSGSAEFFLIPFFNFFYNNIEAHSKYKKLYKLHFACISRILCIYWSIYELLAYQYL